MCAFACTMWCEWGEKTFSWFHNVLVSRRLGLDKRGLLVPHATLFFSKAKSLVLQANESDIPEWVWGIKYQIPYLKTKQNCFSFSLDILSKRENLAGRIFFWCRCTFLCRLWISHNRHHHQNHYYYDYWYCSHTRIWVLCCYLVISNIAPVCAVYKLFTVCGITKNVKNT